MSNEENTEESKEALTLSKLGPNKGARSPRKRLGRGEASGVGKTCGKGHKGQKSRSGASIPAWFEGGQMPLYRRVGKIGFQSRKRIQGINQYQVVSLDILDRFEDGAEVTPEALAEKGYKAKSSQKAGIKVVGSGKVTKKLTVKLHAVTKSAKEAIEKAGGAVETI